MIQSPAGYQGDVRIKRYLDFYQPGYGVAMLSSGTAFTPLSLFAAGEQGAWYDPSDFSTLFQDSLGTTPVTAVEQNIGLCLDKSQGLTPGAELVTNGTFSDGTTGWASDNVGAGSGTFTVVSGQGVVTVSANYFWVYSAITTVVGKWYRAQFTLANAQTDTFIGKSDANNIVSKVNDVLFVNGTSTAGTKTVYFLATATTTYLYFQKNGAGNITFDNVTACLIPGNHAYQSTPGAQPLLSARVNELAATSTLSTQNVTTIAAGYTLYFTGAGSITLSGTATGTYSAGSHAVTCTDGTLTVTVTGSVLTADLRQTNSNVGLPVYQSVTTSTDYDTTDFPVYFRFNGIGTFLVTNTVALGSVDKAQLFVGLRKNNATAQGAVTELSVSVGANDGTFNMFAPTGAGQNDYSINSRGTINPGSLIITGITAPDTSVLSGLMDISGDSRILRRNGADAGTSTADQGTGNFGSYPLYVGMRAGVTIPLSGRIYAYILRFSSANLSASTVANTEVWVNSKTKAYA